MAGYTRQDTNDNIATGKVINASDFDNEYNQNPKTPKKRKFDFLKFLFIIKMGILYVL